MRRPLETETATYLESLVPNLLQVMQSFNSQGAVFVNRSTKETSHYYWGQIVKNAGTLGYFADNSPYSAWVTLNMTWNREARLVFAFHAIGRPFSGSLTCAPFLEFRDQDEDRQVHSTVMPVTDEAFIFFFDETLERTKGRFAEWREKVVAVTLKQLGEIL